MMNKFILLHVLVMILSSWLWVIVQRNILVGLLVFVLSIVLFIYFRQSRPKKIRLLLLILNIVLIIIVFKQAFDQSIFRNSALDIQKYYRRHEFYANGLGKIYTNRFTLAYFKDYNLPLSKLQHNFFANLDPNLYFFASHPRERAGINEFEKFPSLYFIFFIAGIIYILQLQPVLAMFYLLVAVLVNGLISPAFNFGPLLLFPFVMTLIALGLTYLLIIFKYIFKKIQRT